MPSAESGSSNPGVASFLSIWDFCGPESLARLFLLQNNASARVGTAYQVGDHTHSRARFTVMGSVRKPRKWRLWTDRASPHPAPANQSCVSHVPEGQRPSLYPRKGLWRHQQLDVLFSFTDRASRPRWRLPRTCGGSVGPYHLGRKSGGSSRLVVRLRCNATVAMEPAARPLQRLYHWAVELQRDESPPLWTGKLFNLSLIHI